MAHFFALFLALLVAKGYCTYCSTEQLFDIDFCTHDIQGLSPNSLDFLGFCNSTISCLEAINCTKAEDRTKQISDTCEYSQYYATDFATCANTIKNDELACTPEFEKFISSPVIDQSGCHRYNEVLNCIFYEINELCGDDDDILNLGFLKQSNKLEIAKMCWPEYYMP